MLATSSLAQLPSHIKACLRCGLAPFIQSSPGMGKSAMVKTIASEYKLKLIDHRLSTSAPEDFTGIPQFKNNKASFAPFDLFPLEDDPIPSGHSGWLLFLDEFNSAPRHIQAAAYKLILDRQVGQYSLHPDVYIVCAGNRQTDKAITNELSTAMTSRLVHLSLEVSTQDWINHVAIPQEYSQQVIAYLSAFPDRLVDFDTNNNTQEKTFCCPRTWEFVNRLVQTVGTDDAWLPVYCGAITSGVAIEFIRYCSVFGSIPSYAEVAANPQGAPIPDDKPVRFACVVSLVQQLNAQINDGQGNTPEILSFCTYINRFTTDLRILFYRMLISRNKAWLQNKEFMMQVQDIVRHLNG